MEIVFTKVFEEDWNYNTDRTNIFVDYGLYSLGGIGGQLTSNTSRYLERVIELKKSSHDSKGELSHCHEHNLSESANCRE